MKKKIFFVVLIYLFASLSLFPQENIKTIYVNTVFDSPEEQEAWQQSKERFEDLWDRSGYKTVFASLAKSATEEEIIKLAETVSIPLVLYSTISIDSSNLEIKSRLIHTKDRVTVGETQSGGGLELGADGKWTFIVRQLASLADEFDIVLPEKKEESPEVKTEEIAEGSVVETVETGEIAEETDNKDKSWFAFDSIDISPTLIIPVGRFRDFSLIGAGGEIAAAMKLFSLPLDVRVALGAAWEQSESPYVDTLLQFSALLQVGYTFRSKEVFSLGLRGSVGMIGHFASGNLNTLDEVDYLFYFDQYYGLEPVFRLRPRNKQGDLRRISYFLTPGFFFFPGEEYWGLQITTNLGISIHF
jgi:hypothetical protein